MKIFSFLPLVLLVNSCSTPAPVKGAHCVFRRGGESNYINCMVRESFDELKACYAASPAAQTYEELSIRFDFILDTQGAVKTVKTRSDKRHQDLAACQEKVFQTIIFPELGKHEVTQGRYNFVVKSIVN